jgi:hypothetical protein
VHSWSSILLEVGAGLVGEDVVLEADISVGFSALEIDLFGTGFCFE